MKPKSKSGQSLIEVLTALAVVLLVIIALIRATTSSMKGSDFSKMQVLATRYAQEGIEWIRAERDKDWDNINVHTTGAPLCLMSLAWSSDNCDENDYIDGTKFKRQATLTKEGEKVKIEVIVGWQDSSGDHQSQLSTYLTNWR